MASTTQQPTMQLKIISNVEEIGQHQFNRIPTSTTIGWIQRHLRDTLPSHPPIEQQRFLYQGRFLENESMTLASLFGESPACRLIFSSICLE
jgi:hypothetical protein